MKHFICEFITGGGIRGKPFSSPLKREGKLICEALANQITALPNAELQLTLDDRITSFDIPPTAWVGESDDAWQTWETQLKQCDTAWLIAPETTGILHRLTLLAEKVGCHIVGSGAAAVLTCASKNSLFQQGVNNQLPVIDTCLLGEYIPTAKHGWIVKPDCSAGAEFCYYINKVEKLPQFANPEEWVIQPYIKGQPISLSTLMCKGQGIILSCNKQFIKQEAGMLKLIGLEVNGLAMLRVQFSQLVNQIAALFPELLGFVGIDMIIGDKGQTYVVEINPRITTAIVGLPRSIGVNVATLLMDVVEYNRLPQPPRLDYPVYLKLDES